MEPHMVPRPTDRQTLVALRAVARALDLQCASVVDGSYYFIVSDEWALSISPDDAGRFVLQACYGSRQVARLWAFADNLGRLTELARDFKVAIEAQRR